MQTVQKKTTNTAPKKVVAKKAGKTVKGNIDAIFKAHKQLKEKGISLNYLKP